jgi:hypothetical protein
MMGIRIAPNKYRRSSNLIGYYPFAQANTDTSAYDRSGQGNHLTKGAALTWDNNASTGVWKTANTATTVAASASANDFSLILAVAAFGAWQSASGDSLILSWRASITAPGGDIPILGNTQTTTPGLRVLAKSTGKIYLQTRSAEGTTTTGSPSTITVADGSPHHVVLGIDGQTGTARMCVDGVLDTVYTNAAAFTLGHDLKATARDFRIGGAQVSSTPTYSSVDAAWKELQILRIPAAGLPSDFVSIANTLYRNPYLAFGSWAGV